MVLLAEVEIHRCAYGRYSRLDTTRMSPNNATEMDEAIEAETMASARKAVVLNIAVGSGNPCKINAVKAALQQVIGSSSSDDAELNVEGFDVQSGVPDQPFGDVSQNK